MTVNQQRIGDVLADDGCLVHIDIVDVINEVYTSSLAGIGRLDNPDVLLAFMLLQFLVVIVEVSKLVWQDVRVRAEVEGRLSKALLHAYNVEAESIFAGDLVALWEVVDLLVLVQPFILV